MKHLKEFFDVNKPDKTKNKKRSTPGKYHTPNKTKSNNTPIENTYGRSIQQIYGYNKEDKIRFDNTLPSNVPDNFDKLDDLSIEQLLDEAQIETDSLMNHIEEIKYYITPDELQLNTIDDINDVDDVISETDILINQLNHIKENINEYVDSIMYYNENLQNISEQIDKKTNH